MQATTHGPYHDDGGSTVPASAPAPETAAPAPETGSLATTSPEHLADDLYAVVVFLHKNCNPDLLAALGTLELTLTQTKLLHHLDGQERDVTLKEAAEFVNVSLPAASRTVDDLYRRGFVERHEDTADRRMKRVSLTESGRSTIRELNAARLSGLEQFAKTLTDDERTTLSQALSTLLERDDIAACRPSEPVRAERNGGEA